MTDRDPFPGSHPLTADDLAFYVSVKPVDDTDESPYKFVGLSSAVHCDAVERMFIDGVEVREPRWRRVLNWAWRRLSGKG